MSPWAVRIRADVPAVRMIFVAAILRQSSNNSITLNGIKRDHATNGSKNTPNQNERTPSAHIFCPSVRQPIAQRTNKGRAITQHGSDLAGRGTKQCFVLVSRYPSQSILGTPEFMRCTNNRHQERSLTRTGQMTPQSALPKSRPGKLGTQMKKNHQYLQ